LPPWQPITHRPPAAGLDLERPFVAVLLQAANDPRVRLDADGAPRPAALVRSAVAACRAIDPTWQVVAVLPSGQRPTPLTALRLAGRDAANVQLAPAAAAPIVAAAAAATITINHRAATVAMLAGTPVVHLGRALFELRGVTTFATARELCDPAARVLGRALGRDRPSLRRRFLTWLLRHGHVWCPAVAPNHNGMLGLVQAIERRLGGPACPDQALPYRSGPLWPLAEIRS
jgi:hypothetical protein